MAECPHCEYNKKRAQNWRVEAYRLAGHPLPEQKPVAWMDSDWHYQLHKKGMVVMHKDEGDVLIGEPQPLYTHPQQRTWVGLTDEEAYEIYEGLTKGQHLNDLVKAIETKLKEKNT